MSRPRLQLLDFLRGVAIIFVVVDHLFGWLGLSDSHEPYKRWFIFSVAPLFFLAGVTYGLSWLTKPPAFVTSKFTNLFNWAKQFWSYFYRKASKLIFAYLLALLIINLYQKSPFTLTSYFNQVLTFPSQFYFISIYLQLLLLAPLLCWCWQKSAPKFTKNSGWLLLLANLALLLLATILNQVPVFSSSWWLPARLLGGGIELWVFGTGTMLAHYYHLGKIPRAWQSPKLLLTLGGIGLLLVSLSPLRQYVFAHPPVAATLIYCASLLCLLTVAHRYLNRFLPFINKAISFLGTYSLDIFLFHSFVMEEILRHYLTHAEHPYWWQFLSVATGSIMGSLILGWICQKLLLLPTLIVKKTKSPTS